LSRLYSARIDGHYNKLIADLNTPPNVPRRLKRLWPTDLAKNQQKIRKSTLSLYKTDRSFIGG
jgi:hypothetical protein